MKNTLTGLIFFISCFVSSITQADIKFTVNDLGTLGGREAVARDINNNGEVVGWSYSNTTGYHAFVYSQGNSIDLFPLRALQAYGINDAGQVVGQGRSLGSSDDFSFLYTNGKIESIGPVEYIQEAHKINNVGQIVGISYLRPYLYSDGKMTMLQSPQTTMGSANDINDNGQVTGWIEENNDGKWHGFIYSDNSMKFLETLGGDESGGNAINANGYIAGWSSMKNGEEHAFLYDGINMKDLGTLGGKNAGGLGINSKGQVVGWSFISDNNTQHGFFYDDNKTMDLNDLIDPNLHIMIESVNAINDLGQIVGVGTTTSGERHAIILNPIPEPSTITLLGISAFGVLTWAWRRNRRAI